MTMTRGYMKVGIMPMNSCQQIYREASEKPYKYKAKPAGSHYPRHIRLSINSLGAHCYEQKNLFTHLQVAYLPSPATRTHHVHCLGDLCRELKMILRLRRLTPGYFRLLQTQTTPRLAVAPQQGSWVAILLAMSGFSLSAFSTQKMTAAPRR